MRNLLKTLLLGALVVGASCVAVAQTPSVSLSMDSGSFSLTRKGGGLLLSGGTDAAGDGFALQLGFYSGATAGSLFSGTWTPFAGAGTAVFSTLSIGDLSINGAGDGTFAFSLNLDSTVVGLPAAGQILALRFYDSTSVAAAANFGSVSNAAWTWVAPNFPPPALNFSLDDVGVSWIGGNVATTGTAVIPEPSTYALILGALTLGIVGVRRWRK